MTDCKVCRAHSARIQKLETELSNLRATITFHETHATLSLGIAGEKIVANISQGTLTIHTAAHDIELENGATIEVKSSKLSSPSKHSINGKRWQWEKIFGQSGEKHYDFLVLLGEVDGRFSEKYTYNSSTYIAFFVPFESVAQFTTGGVGGGRAIRLGSDPDRARGKSAGLFDEFQIDLAEINELITLARNK